MANRPNNAIWKIRAHDSMSPLQLLNSVVAQYGSRHELEPMRFPELKSVQLKDDDNNRAIRLFIRKRYVKGMYQFVSDRLAEGIEAKIFVHQPKDTCLFIMTPENLYVITSGSGYHIIEDFVDYSYPFDVAKKVVANSFRSAEKRKLTGAQINVNEQYRNKYSIDRSKATDAIWKKLVGEIDFTQLPTNSFLRQIINPDKVSTAEIKSSFTLKKSLSVSDIIKLVADIEDLPEPSDEHKKEMEFLDCLQPVKSPTLRKALGAELIDRIKHAMDGNLDADFDICDPDDIARYRAGTNYKLDDRILGDEDLGITEVIEILREKFIDIVSDAERFAKVIKKMQFTYTDGEEARLIPHRLLDMIHGQIDYVGQTYFLIDKNWYRGQGDFLKVLVEDFIEQVFNNVHPTYFDAKAEISLIQWQIGWDEDDYNKAQALADGFYYGDKLFLRRGRGKIELFDLLYVNEELKITYIIHVKDGFDAKMRDVCSQIETARDVIRVSVNSGQSELKHYYNTVWKQNKLNATKNILEAKFVSWFKDFTVKYLVVCSTKHEFDAPTFHTNVAHQSYVAKREIINAREEFKGKGIEFYLAHAKKVDHE